jgi:hypothetical protein
MPCRMNARKVFSSWALISSRTMTMGRACSRVHLEARMSSTRDRVCSAGVCTGVGVVLACKTAPRANLHQSEVVQLASDSLQTRGWRSLSPFAQRFESGTDRDCEIKNCSGLSTATRELFK